MIIMKKYQSKRIMFNIIQKSIWQMFVYEQSIGLHIVHVWNESLPIKWKQHRK